MKTLVYSGDGLKSIPIQNLPPKAWTTITGRDIDGVGYDVITLYETIPWLYRGVEARCNALSGMPVSLHKGSEGGAELEDHEWPFDVKLSQLINALYRDYILFGRAYTWINHNVAGTIVTGDKEALRRLQPESITPVYNPVSGIESFKRRTPNGQDIPIPAADIAPWFKPPVRTETGYGKSDAMVALAASGVIRNVDLFSELFFKQGAVNPTLISVEGGIQETDKQRLQNWVERALTGIRNAFKMRVIEGKLSSVSLGYPLKDLVSIELTSSKREDIATALGVPQTMLFSSAANYATAHQDDLHFYDKTVKPDGLMLQEVLNEYIFIPLGYYLTFHPERLEIYQRLEADKAQSVRTLTDGNIWTRREARVATNMPETPAQDDPQYAEFTEKPKEPEPVPDESQTPPESPSDDLMDDDEFTEEMKRWRTKALNRFNEGKLHKALDFTSDVIPSTLIAAVKGALEGCKSKDSIRDVFDSSMHWVAYP